MVDFLFLLQLIFIFIACIIKSAVTLAPTVAITTSSTTTSTARKPLFRLLGPTRKSPSCYSSSIIIDKNQQQTSLSFSRNIDNIVRQRIVIGSSENQQQQTCKFKRRGFIVLDPTRISRLRKVIMMPSSKSSQDGMNNNSIDDNDNDEKENQIGLVKNFRKAKGFEQIYRCASTDVLGDLFDDYTDESAPDIDDNEFDDRTKDKIAALTYTQNIILNDTGLILDLRSPSERNETNARKWMSNANGGKYEIQNFERDERTTSPKAISTLDFKNSSNRNYNNNNNSPLRRIVYRIDVLSPNRLFDYMSKNWVSSPLQKAKYTFNSIFDSYLLHEQRMDILNEKGLKGLYEAIIETSGPELETGLKSIVEYFESLNNVVAQSEGSITSRKGGVVIHCVQGKDRTGLLVMLCQSILGLDDEAIISDYHQSEILLNKKTSEKTSAAASMATKDRKGKLSREIFSGSPSEVMASTLGMIREKYGSIDGYLDSIGFDSLWRKRFLRAVSVHHDHGGRNIEENISEGNIIMQGKRPIQSKL